MRWVRAWPLAGVERTRSRSWARGESDGARLETAPERARGVHHGSTDSFVPSVSVETTTSPGKKIKNRQNLSLL
jgi:hypothetical protein